MKTKDVAPTELAMIAATLCAINEIHRSRLPLTISSPRPDLFFYEALDLIEQAEKFLKERT